MNLKAMLKKHEGFREKPYRCTADKLTIGYGRNLDDVGITREEAEYLLDNDIKKATFDALSIFPLLKSYSEARQAVLINMVFNLGKTRFRGFKNFIKAVKSEDWERAAVEMEDSLWYKQVGKRAKELQEAIR